MGAPPFIIATCSTLPLADFVFAASAARAAVIEVAVPSVSILGRALCVEPSGVIAGAGAGVGGGVASPAEDGSGAVGCAGISATGALGVIARYIGRAYLYVPQPIPTISINMTSHSKSLPDFISRTSGRGAGAGVCGNCTGAEGAWVGIGALAIGGGGVTD